MLQQTAVQQLVYQQQIQRLIQQRTPHQQQLQQPLSAPGHAAHNATSHQAQPIQATSAAAHAHEPHSATGVSQKKQTEPFRRTYEQQVQFSADAYQRGLKAEHEGSHRAARAAYQTALLYPDTPVAREARQGIERANRILDASPSAPGKSE